MARLTGKVELTCANCGVGFRRYPSEVPKNSCCSRACWNATKPKFVWAEWAAKNRASLNAGHRKRHANNPEQYLEYRRRWREKNKDKIKAASILRKTARKAAGAASQQEVIDLLTSTKSNCVYCGLPCKIEIDHFNAISKGGGGELGNLVPCCRSCNLSKAVKPGEDWLLDAHGLQGLARTIMFMEGRKIDPVFYTHLATPSPEGTQ